MLILMGYSFREKSSRLLLIFLVLKLIKKWQSDCVWLPNQSTNYNYNYMAESASGQDEATTRGGKKGPSCPLYMDFRVDPAKKKFSFWPYNKYFIDQQACSVKMAGYFPRSYFAFFIKKAKKELSRCTSRLVNKAYFQLWPVQPIHI